jgi:hypothetical protein
MDTRLSLRRFCPVDQQVEEEMGFQHWELGVICSSFTRAYSGGNKSIKKQAVNSVNELLSNALRHIFNTTVPVLQSFKMRYSITFAALFSLVSSTIAQNDHGSTLSSTYDFIIVGGKCESAPLK